MSEPFKPPDDDMRWRVDGVRHQIGLRVLPAQRHDVLGPLSVLRMSLGLMKRRMASGALDAAGAAERVAELESQVADSVAAVAAMRCWDAGRNPPQPAAAVLQACVALMRTEASLRGHRLDGPVPRTKDAPDAPDAPDLAVPDAHYAIVGCIAHALDTATVPTHLSVSLQADGVRLARQGNAGSTLGVAASAGLRAIDRAALQWLLDDLGWTLQETRQEASQEARQEANEGALVLRWP